MTEEIIEQSESGFDAEAEDSNEQTEVEQTSDEVVDEIEDEESQNDEPSEVEIEYEGENYRIPPELKDAILRYQDYTTKTQEVADNKKQIEQERAAFEQERQLAAQSYQRQQATLEARVSLAALDNQLKQYEQVNWAAYTDQDPVEAQKHFMEYNRLKGDRDQMQGYIKEQEEAFQAENAKTLQQKLEEGRTQLQRDIPNWSPELASSISTSALEMGMTEQELNQLVEPRHVKILHYAKIGYEAMKKAKSKPIKESKPIKTAKTSRSGTVQNPDNMSVEDWQKWRMNQLKKQA